MCSKIENTLKELTSPHTLSTKQFISKVSVFELNYISSFSYQFNRPVCESVAVVTFSFFLIFELLCISVNV